MSHLRHPSPPRYSPKNMAKPVAFRYLAPEAKAVYLAGDFNDWNETAHPMKRHIDGGWHLEVPLPHGHHHYLFFVDGKPVLDPRAQGIARNERNEKVSMLAVS